MKKHDLIQHTCYLNPPKSRLLETPVWHNGNNSSFCSIKYLCILRWGWKGQWQWHQALRSFSWEEIQS